MTEEGYHQFDEEEGEDAISEVSEEASGSETSESGGILNKP
jgi:hypothetical protein